MQRGTSRAGEGELQAGGQRGARVEVVAQQPSSTRPLVLAPVWSPGGGLLAVGGRF